MRLSETPQDFANPESTTHPCALSIDKTQTEQAAQVW
ncbi:hypothetical protein DSM3645_01580 [Blastopirellula marina DSM 3645]|uniref:Uncharacterized protein n=1 Tax=Blastopirellula marina DSM 3645 TaxID=314230 RepID=A3ZN35_9BACT|nr:hypothetical protein DSM3645_01580 [Blastopirellula marina DSM 3645]